MSLVLTLLSFAIIAVFGYFYVAFSHWKKKGVPFIQPTFPLGNIESSFTDNFSQFLTKIYEIFKKGGAKYGGIYFGPVPVFIPIDPEVIKSIMLKNFDNFHDRGIYYNEEKDPMSAHLFALSGIKWKNMRSKLSPTFTSGKLKMMFPTILECSKDIKTVLNDHFVNDKALDVKELSATFSTDVIGSCVFGVQCNSILNPDTEFRTYGRLFIDNDFFQKAKIMIGFFAPNLLKFFNIPFIKPIVAKYLSSIVKNTIEYREKNNIQRKDFLDLLIRLKNNENINDDEFLTNKTKSSSKGTDADGFTAAQIAAQAFVFYVAGFETSSSTATYCMYELAQNQDIQQKVKDEIANILEKHNGELTYEAINEMTYLDRVVNETLRKRPPLFMLNRICTKDFKVENTDIVINKGTRVIIPINALQSDSKYYPNPDIFDPDRFLPEELEKRVPYTYLPFGEGPRFCIGMRFGMLQTKIALISLLKNYKYSIHKKTPMPVDFISNLALLTNKQNIYLKLEKC